MESKRQQEMQEDIAFLRGRFEELDRNIVRPHSLDADSLRGMLDELEQVPETFPKVKSYKPVIRLFAGMAACFVIAFGAFYVVGGTGGKVDLAAPVENAISAPQMAAEPDMLSDTPEAMAVEEESAPLIRSVMDAGDESSSAGAAYAQDYLEIRDQVFKLNGGYSPYLYSKATKDAAAGTSQTESSGVAGTSFRADFSGESAQQEETGAGDIVKTDGNYLYSYVREDDASRNPAIFIADADNMMLSSKIELTQGEIKEFYITGNRLVTVAGREGSVIPQEVMPSEKLVDATDDMILKELNEQTAEDIRDGAPSTETLAVEVVVYDIADRTQPRTIKTFAQNGSFVASRVMDGILYTVSDYRIHPDFTDENTRMTDLVPVVYDSEKQTASLISAEKIAIAPESTFANYAVISTLDIATGKTASQAVLGGGDGVYMSERNLYIYYSVYNETLSMNQRMSGDGWTPATSRTGTNILQFDVNKSDVTLAQTGYVDGYTDGSFAFGDYQGNLYVTVTAEPYSDNAGISSSLYVLDEGMNHIGALESFASGERITSVRYVEDKAYITTTYASDPIFTADMSNPTEPKLMGQLNALDIN